MEEHTSRVGSVRRFVHGHLLGLVLVSYLAAAVAPGFGLWVRQVSCGSVAVFGETTRVSLPVVMLAFLLLNAGFGVRGDRLARLARGPGPLAVGLAGNLLVPVAFLLLVSHALRLWHNAGEAQNLLVGLALNHRARYVDGS